MVLAEDLRQAVLQAALQGKLTEQLETDSDVDEMLIDIKKEKEELIADKVIKKEKQLPEIQDKDIPFDIPENWRWVRLRDVVKSISAGGDKPKNFSKEKTKLFPIPVIANGETNDGILGYTDEATIKEKSLSVSGRGTIGFSIVRTEPYVPIVRLLVITPLRLTNLYYIQCVLKSLVEIGIGTAVKQLTVPMIQSKVIPLPPIEEQQRIVDKIKEIMPKIDEYEKIEKELEALKKKFPTNLKDALLQAAMQGKLTEQLESDSSVDELLVSIQKEKKQLIKEKKIYKDKKLVENVENKFDIDIPNNWRFVNLQEICMQITDGEHKTPNRVSEYQGYYLLSARNILNGKLVLDDVDYVSKREYDVISKRCNPNRNDILISCSGSVGRCCLISDDNNYVMVRSAAMIRCLQVNNKYIMYAIQSPYIQAQIDGLKKQSVQANLFQSAIASLLIPIPSIEEQQRIVEKLDALLPLCDDLKEE